MDIVIRALIAFILLWLLARTAGRGTLGELSSFDLLVFVTMGDLVQQGITGEDKSLTGGLLAVATFVVLAVVMNFAMAKWPRVGRALEGSPVILLQEGKISHLAMKRQRITTAELLSAARQSGYESLDSVLLAILETNGKISFFDKSRSGGGSDAGPEAG